MGLNQREGEGNFSVGENGDEPLLDAVKTENVQHLEEKTQPIEKKKTRKKLLQI